MTTPRFCAALTAIVVDLTKDLPAEQRYQHLLATMQQIFPYDAVDLFQRELIRQKLEKHHNNQAAAARERGLNRSNFYRLLQRLDLR